MSSTVLVNRSGSTIWARRTPGPRSSHRGLFGQHSCSRPVDAGKHLHMAKDHGSSVKNDEQYEGLRKKGMSKSRAAAIANSPGASKKGGKNSNSGGSSQSSKSSGSGSGGNRKQKQAAGRKGGKATASKSS